MLTHNPSWSSVIERNLEFYPRWKWSPREPITPALDPLGGAGLKAWLMTNCDGIIPHLLPWTAQPQADVSPALPPSAASTSNLKQCQGGNPPGRNGKFPQFLDPRQITFWQITIFLFSACSRLELNFLAWKRRKAAVDFLVSLPSFTLQRRHTVSI